MQDGKAGGDAAGEWLRRNVTDPDVQIDITWTVGEPNDRVFDEVLTILFGPETGPAAA